MRCICLKPGTTRHIGLGWALRNRLLGAGAAFGAGVWGRLEDDGIVTATVRPQISPASAVKHYGPHVEVTFFSRLVNISPFSPRLATFRAR